MCNVAVCGRVTLATFCEFPSPRAGGSSGALPGRRPPHAVLPAGAYLRRQRGRLEGAEGDHGVHAQAGADRLQHDALRGGVCEAEFAAEQRTRLEKSLHRRAKEMGFELVKPDGEVVLTPEPMFLNA